MKRWLRLLRPGDWLVAALGLGAVLAVSPVPGGQPSNAVLIRAVGAVFRQASLDSDQRISVPGPLGTTVVHIANRKVRIESDPSPRQYCVLQGWLERPGQAAVCLPNRTSIELTGSDHALDSVSY